jgi:hypothetical protein
LGLFLGTKGYDSGAFWRLNNVDPSQIEAYEHWIVSQWLAERLIEKGEMVTKDFLGLTIWGWACTARRLWM